MATKTEVVEFVGQYVTQNERPCPKAAVISHFGESGLDLLLGAAKDGTLTARRGRNGGYQLTGNAPAAEVSSEDAPVEAGNAPPSDEAVEVDLAAIAERFRALEAKLAAENGDEAQTENSQ